MKEQSRGWGVNLSGWCQRPQQQTELALYVCICKHACAFFSSVTYGIYTTPSFPSHFIETNLFSCLSDEISFTVF